MSVVCEYLDTVGDGKYAGVEAALECGLERSHVLNVYGKR